EGCATFVHQLQLLLRIEILRDMANDAHQLALPVFETRRPLLDEIEQIFLGQAELSRDVLLVPLGSTGILPLLFEGRNSAPQIVVGRLVIGAALLGPTPLLGEVRSRAVRV